MTTALNFGLRRAAARLSPDTAPDGELLSRFIASRDEAAFALLVRRHAGMVFGTCRRVLGNVADADDAFQAAFVVLVRKAHSLTGRACVGNFLYGVAFHTALKARAMATKRRAKEAKVTRFESADAGELTRVLDEELSKLPDKYREPVVLCELDGVSRKDAAARLGIPEGTVSSRLATAHRMLHKRLVARGFAAVAIAAVLGTQAFAVPEGLTEAAVRAAADGPPAGMTQLVSEVSKMLLWNKLKAGVVLTGVLLACGIGFGMAAKGFADDKPAVKAPTPKVEDKKKTVRDALQGKWELTSLVIDEVDQKTPKASKWWTFDADTLTETRPDLKGRVIENTYELDLSSDPPQLVFVNGKVRRHTIFKLDGDTLVVCGSTGSEQKNPPKGFTKKDAGEGVQNLTVQTFTRVKKSKDEDLIQGVWEAETVQVKGKQMPAGQVYKVMRWKFHGTSLTITTEDSDGSVVFELDATASPKTLATHEAGAKKSKVPHAIYDLDGDMLKVCHNTDEGDAGPVPISFRAGPNDKDELIVFKRVKEEKKPAKKADDAKSLQGKWVTKAVTWDPPFQVPPGAKHIPAQHVLTFTDKELTWATFTPDDVKTRSEQTKPYKLDQTTSPQELTSGDNECVYELDGDTLKVAMYFLTPGRPKGFNAKDSPPGKGHIILIELTREKEEKKPEADKSYSLKDGEVLKLIAAPFAEDREEVFKLKSPGVPFRTADECLMAVTVKDGKAVAAHPFANRQTPGVDAPGKPLALFLDHGLRIDMTKVADPNWLLESTILDADVVLKQKAAPSDLIAALQNELKAKLGVDVTLKFEEAEREVVVIGGKHTLNPPPAETPDGRVIGKASVVHFVAEDKVEHPNGLHGDTRAFRGELAKFVGQPVVDESDLAKNVVPVHMMFHWRQPATAKTNAEDRDPAKVIKNLEEQTGLTFKLEKRKVRVLVVAKADEPKAKPVDNPLLGKWKEVEFTGGGVKGKQDDVHHWEISGDAIRYTTTNPKKEGHTFTYTLATDRTPPELTTTNEQKEQRHHIYKLDGDTLMVAFTAGGAAANPPPAPKGFTEKEVGAEAFKLLCVVKYERVKDDLPADPKAKPPEKKDEPAWKADFDKLYALADGEVVKYIHATTPAAQATRTDFYREVIARGKKDAKPLPGAVMTFRYSKDGAKCRQVGGGADDGEGQIGMALEHVLSGLFDETEAVALDIDLKLSGVHLAGDWVVRASATPDERMKAIQKVLTDECKVPVKLELKDVEREVLVALGEWKLTPRAWRKDAVDVYALEKVVDKKLDGEAYLKGKGDLSRFLRDAGGLAGKRVVAGEIKNAPKEMTWYLHERNSEKISEQQEDHDADAILKNVSEQTGLTFKAEKRKVPVLTATKVGN